MNAMVAELIRVAGDRRVSYNSAVGHIATALSPLGAAAGITATLSACAFEFKRFNTQRAIASDIIRMRQETIVRTFEAERAKAAMVHFSLQNQSFAIQAMVQQSSDLSVSEEQRILAVQTISILTGQMLHYHITSGDQLIRLSDSLRLGDAEAAVAAWRAINS
ncbi:hypothetical protein ACIQGZ_00315 [Streptomyces sp. NPDC092296]|uniref:hypothetical protein n=1 Tax=Streptomyces sp. NPDC092296 TaxID=3366012 RepID=UPI0038061FD9